MGYNKTGKMVKLQSCPEGLGKQEVDGGCSKLKCLNEYEVNWLEPFLKQAEAIAGKRPRCAFREGK